MNHIGKGAVKLFYETNLVFKWPVERKDSCRCYVMADSGSRGLYNCQPSSLGSLWGEWEVTSGKVTSTLNKPINFVREENCIYQIWIFFQHLSHNQYQEFIEFSIHNPLINDKISHNPVSISIKYIQAQSLLIICHEKIDYKTHL